MEFDTQMTYKQLSFSDFDEDRSNLLNNQTEGGLEFSDDESVQSLHDEGAIAVLTMDEIRNMKNLEMDYERKKSQMRDQYKDSEAFVKPPPELDWENINNEEIEQLDIEIGSRSETDSRHLALDNNQTPETPRPSAQCLDDLKRQISVPINQPQGSVEISALTSKLNAFIKDQKSNDLDVSSNSIDNGDMGSTKGFNNKSEEEMYQECMTPKTQIGKSEYSGALINLKDDDQLSLASVDV